MKKRWKLAGLGLLAIGLLYLLVTCQTTTRLMRRDIQKAQEKTRELYFLPGDRYVEAEKRTGSHFPQVRYLQNYMGYPVYSNTLTQYLSPGEAYHVALLEQLEKAEHYIFPEFFIVQEGVFWDSIYEILKRKTVQGADPL